MLICLALEDKSLDSLLAINFEEAKYFFLINNRTKETWTIRNLANGGTVYLVTAHKPNLVITGNLLPGSFDFLRASGVKIISGIFGQTGKEAFDKYQKGKLKVIDEYRGAVRGKLL